MKSKLNPPETAPKDGKVIHGDFGYPWLIPAVWNEYDGKWAVCTIQSCSTENGKIETYWETDQENHSSLIGWMPMPESKKQ